MTMHTVRGMKMSIKAELDNLNKQDVYSIMLFALYKLKEHSSWASLLVPD